MSGRACLSVCSPMLLLVTQLALLAQAWCGRTAGSRGRDVDGDGADTPKEQMERLPANPPGGDKLPRAGNASLREDPVGDTELHQ